MNLLDFEYLKNNMNTEGFFGSDSSLANLFLLQNKYNTELKIKNDVLIRKIETETQTGMSKTERAANVVGVFSVANKKAVVCKNIVLVDDVFTTGATTDECARVLKRAGASRVFVLTALKTVSSMSHTGKTKRKKR